MELQFEQIGVIFANARKEQGLDILSAAQKLKIRHYYLQALEEGRREVLPETVYVLGIIRKYSTLLGLDSEVIINQWQGLETPVAKKRVVQHTSSSMPNIALVFSGFAAFALIFAGYWIKKQQVPVADHIVEAYVPPKPVQKSQQMTGSDFYTYFDWLPSLTPRNTPVSSLALELKKTQQLILQINAPVWIEIKGNANHAYRGIVNKNIILPLGKNLSINIGNSQNVKVLYNKKNLELPKGKVLKNIKIDALLDKQLNGETTHQPVL